MSRVVMLVGILVIQVTDVDGVDKVMEMIGGDGAKFSSSFLLTCSLPGTSDSAGTICIRTCIMYTYIVCHVFPIPCFYLFS